MRAYRRIALLGTTTVLATTLATVPLASSVSAATAVPPGQLDPNFGNFPGEAVFGSGFSSAMDSVAVDSQGRIIVGAVGSGQLSVYRLTRTGSLDSAFAGGVYTWANAAGSGGDPAGALAVDSQDRVYVTGALQVPAGHEVVAVLRLATNGTPDTTWGPNGIETVDFGGSANDHGTSLALDESEHRLYVGAWEGPDSGSRTDFAVLAYDTSTGSLDTTFNNNGNQQGVFTLDLGANANDTVRDIAVVPSGAPNAHDIVVTGFTSDGDQDNTGLLMLTDNGTLEPQFNNGSPVRMDMSSTTVNDGGRSVAVDSHGEIYVSGAAFGGGASGFVAAFGPHGTLTSTFNARAAGSGGVVHTDFGGGSTSSDAGLTVDAQGRVVVTGSGGADPGVARLANDRYPFDTVFHAGGQERLTGCKDYQSTHQNGGADGVASQPDGNLVVAGVCGTSLAVWRVGGGHRQTPLTTTPSTPATADGLQVKADISAVQLDGHDNTVTVAPDAPVSVSFHYNVPAGQPFAKPPLLVFGFVNRGPEVCATTGYDGNVADGNVPASGQDPITVNAPSDPGIYYLAVDDLEFPDGCSDNITPGAVTWANSGQPWANGEPPAGQYIAEVIVDVKTQVHVTSSNGPSDHVTAAAGSIPVDGLNNNLLSSASAIDSLATAPLRTSPLRTSPLRTSPLRTSALDASPLRTSPLRTSPLRTSPLRTSPLRTSSLLPPIPLSDVPLTPPLTWATVLAGTTLANQPLQNVTLQQVASLDPQPAAVASLSFADVDLTRTPFRNVTLTAFLLGNTAIKTLNEPVGGWGQFMTPPTATPTAAQLNLSLVDLELLGANLGSYYTAPAGVIIPTGPVDDLANGTGLLQAPLTALSLRSFWLAQTPFGAIPASAFPDDVTAPATCAGTCTLADVQAADVVNGVHDTLTIPKVLTSSSWPSGLTVNQLLPGLVSLADLPLTSMSPQALADATNATSPYVTFAAALTFGCTAEGEQDVRIDLPAHFRVKPGSETLTVDGTTYNEGSDESSPNTFTFAAGASSVSFASTPPVRPGCTGQRLGTATVQAAPSITLGPATANAEYTTSDADVLATDTNPIVVDDAQPPASAQPLASTLFIGHLTASDNGQDVYRFSVGAADVGTQIAVTLGHVPTGQDYDLSMFGPGQPDLRSTPNGSPLKGAPRGTGVADTSLAPGNDGTNALPEPQTDVPVTPPSGETAWGVSDDRGNVPESLASVVPDGVSGEVQIVVSGFNGSSSDDPYLLLVQFTPPPAPPTCVSTATGAGKEFPANMNGGSRAPAPTIPSTTQTLILTNQERMTALYGATGANSWATVSTSLNTLAARSDVKGVVVPVDANQNVHDAYVYWDAHPCSPTAADQVVTAINAYVDTLRTGLTDLRNVVIAGGDLIVPMARVEDHIAIDNEQTFANDEVYGNQENQLSAALRDGYLLSDDPYGDFNPIPWLDGQAFVPDVALGRLIETPTDIQTAVNQYVSSNGVRSPNSSYTAGYDFNADGAQQVANTLAPRVPPGAAATSINGTWTRSDAVNGMATAAHGYLSINAHYDAYRALPANEFSQGTQKQLLTTADLPSSLSNGILFTIGCHAGLSVADTFINVDGGAANTADVARQLDWPQSSARNGGVYAGNTGYGYGDDAAVAYSEKLMASFATNLDGTMSVGQALMNAKQTYLHLPLAAVDAKVMEEATFYGLPMYRIGATGVQAPAALPTTPGATNNNPYVAGATQTDDFTSASGRHFVQQQSGIGTYWLVQNGTATPEPPVAIPGHPLQPQTSDPVAPDANGKAAHGILVTGLKTHVAAGPLASGLIDPVYSTAVPDGSSFDTEPGTVDAYFPATIAGLVQRGGKDVAGLNVGQFRASGQGGLGFEQLTDQVQYQALYSSSSDFTPPTIGTVLATIDPTSHQPSFQVTTPDGDVTAATVLYLTPTGTWRGLTLTATNANHKFSGTDTSPPAGLGTVVPQYVVQLVDNAGNVAESKSKGQDWTAQTAPIAGAPAVTLGGALTNGVYAGAVSVTVSDGVAPYNVQVDNGPTVPYIGPFLVFSSGPHIVTATGHDNQATTVSFTIADQVSLGHDIPTITVTSPSPAGTDTFYVGATIPLTFSCFTAAGNVIPAGANCFATPATLDNTFGQHTVVLTAISPSTGARTSTSVDYSVQYKFSGLQQPVNDPISAANPMSVFKINSTIPLKFQLQTANGAPIGDVTAQAIANNCLAALSYGKQVGQSAPAVDETVYANAVDSGGCFRYDATAHQFIYNLSSKELNAKSADVFNVKVRLSLQSHGVAIGLK